MVKVEKILNMSKNKKSQEYQMNRIKSFIQNRNVYSEDVDTSKYLSLNNNLMLPINDLEYLYKMTKKLKKFEKFKSNIKFAFYSAKDFASEETFLDIFCVLEFGIECKDTIKLNDQIMNCVYEFENLFISLDDVKIDKYDEKENHLILINMIKKQIPEKFLIKE